MGANGLSLIGQAAITGTSGSRSEVRPRMTRLFACPRSPRNTMWCPASTAFSISGMTVSSKPMMPGRMRSPRPRRARRFFRISSRTGSTRYPAALSSPNVRDLPASGTSESPVRKKCTGLYAPPRVAQSTRSREPGEGGLETIVGREQVLRHHAHVAHDRHEGRVARPARHDVPVEMVADARAGARAEVHAQVEALGVKGGREGRERPAQRLGQVGVLGRGERRKVGRVPARRDHEVAVLVRVAVQYDQAVRRRAEDEALARVARKPGTEDALPLLLGGADVGHAPGRPQDVHAVLPCWSTPRLRRRWLGQADAAKPEVLRLGIDLPR